jgi:predicted metal-binding transcription factor (methanogenesis marker protein 9)
MPRFAVGAYMKKHKQKREDVIEKSRIEELNKEILEKEIDVRAKEAKHRRLDDKVRLSSY